MHQVKTEEGFRMPEATTTCCDGNERRDDCGNVEEGSRCLRRHGRAKGSSARVNQLN